ncbi:MAG: SusC/RagA family TonB-linked outer membrane protein [Balneolaceae bacterium]
MKQFFTFFGTVLLGVILTAEVHAQTVSGTITDASSGASLPGVNVVVQGTNTGTVTDAQGNYTLDVPSLQETLAISYIGYQSQEVPINGRTTIDISLEQQVIRGEEMVVTAFGIAREQRSLSYSTQGVTADHLTDARETNVINSLRGRVAGISISEGVDGLGSSSRVVLRGNRSISGDSQPLYVIDGVPTEGNPQDLSADNIASIDVLKGPNAAALYGSAAQNGVIMIETNRGQAGVSDVSFSSNFMVRTQTLPYNFQNEYGQGTGGTYNSGSEFSWGPRMEGQMVDHWSLAPDDEGKQYALLPQPDARSDVYQNGYSLANTLNASVGGENVQGVLSYTRTDAEGVLPGNMVGRHNISVRVTSQLTEGLTADTKLGYMQQQLDGGFRTTGRFNPWRHAMRMPSNIRTEDARNFDYFDENGLLKQNYWTPGASIGANPYWIMERVIADTKEERVTALASLTYEIMEPLSVMVRASYDGSDNITERKYYNDNYGTAPLGQYGVLQGESSLTNGDFLFSYVEDLNEEWSLDANVGGSIEQHRNRSVNVTTGAALLEPNLFSLSNTALPEVSENQGSPVDKQSLYAFSQVGWRDAIYLNVSARNDWSSTLPAESRSYFYPSVGVSAVLSDLIELPDALTYASVRASWARVGNDAPYARLFREAQFSAGGTSGFITFSDELPAENLKPEQTDGYELGLDLRLFQGRLRVDATAYQTNTINQLFSINLPPGSGASSFFTNGGDVQNRGFEMLLSGTPVQTPSFVWDIDLNYSVNRNTVLRIDDERPRVVRSSSFLREFVIEEGEPFGNMYSRGFVRDDQGRVVVDSKGLPQITSGQSVLVGNAEPDWKGGIMNSFQFGNVNARFLIDHTQGGVIVSRALAILAGDGTLEQTLQGREGGLVFGENFFEHETAVFEDGTPNDAAIDSETFWRNYGGRNQPAGELFTEDATYTKLREVAVGYSLPQSVMSSLPVSNIQVSLVGRNLMYLYKASDNLDPDFTNGTGPAAEGSQDWTPPTTRSIGFNVRVDI